MRLVLRSPVPSDYESIASWIPDAAACARWAGLRVPFPFVATELATLLAVTGGESCCLAEDDGLLVGFGQHWVVRDGVVHLGRIIVSPAQRGRGKGRELCERLVARAVQATGAGAVTLRVYRDNETALGLYLRLGFRPVVTESDEEVLLMRKVVDDSGIGAS